MKNFWIIILLLFSLSLSGCSGTQLSPEVVKALGLPETAEVIVDGFDARQISLHLMHRKVATQYYAGVAASGIKIKPVVERIGDIILITQEVTYIPRPELFPLPAKLDIHPVWGAVTKIAELTLFGYAIHEFAGMFEDSTGDTYTFNDSDVSDSFNKAGRDFSRDSISTRETTTTTELFE